MFHVTPYAGHCPFFTAINYAYEELGKLICVVIKLSKFHFFCFLALCFFNSKVVVRTSFFCIQLCKPQDFVFPLSKFLGILASLFSPLQTWQTSRLAFSFSQAYIFHIRVSFFTSNFDSQHSIFRSFNNRFLFHFLPSQKAITRGSPAFFSRGGAPCYPGERSESWITIK